MSFYPYPPQQQQQQQPPPQEAFAYGQQPYGQQPPYGYPAQPYPPPQQQQQAPYGYGAAPSQPYGSQGGYGGYGSGYENKPPYKQSADPLNTGYPPPPSANNNNGQGPQGDGQGRFNFGSRPRFPDLWATLLFLANLAAYAALSVWGFLDYLNRPPTVSNSRAQTGAQQQQKNQNQTSSGPALTSKDMTQLFTILGVTIGVTFVASILYFLAMKKFPRFMTKMSIFATIIVLAVYVAVLFWYRVWIPAILMAIVLVVNIIFYRAVRSRIPLAATALETACSIVNKYPALMVITFLSLALNLAFTGWWAFSATGLGNKYEKDSTTLALVYVYLVFTMYWVGQVLKNTLHVTVAGVFGTFYFLEGTPAMPRNPTLSAAKRTFTSSFGPICFGSLIIAILRTIRYILVQLSRQHEILAMIVNCILGCIEGLVEYFNSFAYVQVAIYGKGYVEAAKDTFRLMKHSGMNIIAGDLLVGTVLSIACLAMFLLGLGVSFLWGYLAFTSNFSAMVGPIIGISFLSALAGLFFMLLVTMVLDSGVQTTLVCLGEDPTALQRTKPELYQKFKDSYPQLQWRV